MPISRISNHDTPTDTPVVLRHPDGIVTLDGRGALFAISTAQVKFEDFDWVALSPSIQRCGQDRTKRASVESLAAIISSHLGWVLERPQRMMEILQMDDTGWEQHVPHGSAQMSVVNDAISDFMRETGDKDLAQSYLPSFNLPSERGARVDGVYQSVRKHVHVPPRPNLLIRLGESERAALLKLLESF